MFLEPYVNNLRQEFLRSAEALGDDARRLAESLVAPLESSVRLSMLSVLSDAADEITDELMPGAVEIRLRGLNPMFVVTAPSAVEPLLGLAEERADDARGEAGHGADHPAAGYEGAAARVNFRPSAPLKARIEEAATREGLSVNAWLVRAATAALSGDGRRPERRARQAAAQQRFTGWVR